METLYARDWAASICEVFEDFLEKRGIEIPNEDRDLEQPAVTNCPIYGIDYAELEDNVKDIVIKLAVDCMKDSYKNLNITDYSGR